jgi:hypothetical protein
MSVPWAPMVAPPLPADKCGAVFPRDFLGPPMFCGQPGYHDGPHNAEGMIWADARARG